MVFKRKHKEKNEQTEGILNVLSTSFPQNPAPKLSNKRQAGSGSRE